ncbi:MAG TPA: SRPBCC family protein, partial [Polyangiaceae bacterium]|nr:SRPBCC family protein [Polyangiaceae bacterium]
RSVTNLPTKRLYGVGAGRRAIELNKAIHIAVPPEQLFAFFYNFENFPRFMLHLESVTVDGERSHWVARGPAGVRVSWDAEIVRFEPNRLIAWQSLPGSMVQSAGVVRFEADARGGTLLAVHMTYNPPAGALGHTVASLFGADAKHALHDDLLRLKSLFEDGKARGNGQQVSRNDLLK